MRSRTIDITTVSLTVASISHTQRVREKSLNTDRGGERCGGQLLRSCENKTFLVAQLYGNSDTDWCLLVDGRRDDDAADCLLVDGRRDDDAAD